jgi:general secretion pathway protein D
MHFRYPLAAIILTGAFTPIAPAQENALLKQQEQLQAVAVQKVETSLKEALAEAKRLQAAGSTARAAERLRSAVRLLDDPILPKKTTDTWRTQLTDALRLVEAGKKPEVTLESSNPNRDADIARIKAMIEEDKEIRRGVDTVGSLMKAGDVNQAKKEVEALNKKYPTNPTVLVLPNVIARTMSIDDVREVHAKQIENIRLALIDLQKTATMAKIDYELPPDWKEKTERRKPKLNPKLQAVLAALRTPVEIDKTAAPLSDVLKAISSAMKQPIILDKATMQDAGIDSSTATTVSPGITVSARTALKLALANHGLTYVIRDNTIQVVTRDKAASMMETRVYYIGDLITPLGGGFTGVPGHSAVPKTDPEQVKRSVDSLIRQIKESIDPPSWKGGGSDGKGDITYHAASMALIVKASAEVHGMMANTLEK